MLLGTTDSKPFTIHRPTDRKVDKSVDTSEKRCESCMYEDFYGWEGCYCCSRNPLPRTDNWKPKPVRHVCELQGYDPMIDPPCPACERREYLARTAGG